jgi:FtsP/CotA-like multicopper oxidase with cupredoxin domain
MQRRDFVRAGVAGTGAGLLGTRPGAAQLVFPDGYRPAIAAAPSPPVTPFVAPLNIMRRARPISGELDPPPDPLRHQRYDEFKPKEFYLHRLQEFRWQYHPEPPYDRGSWAWGFNGITPGPTFYARYGTPILVRRINDLPPVNFAKVRFALPSATIHLHNAHTASESDGYPDDYFNPGEYWDYHYANFPAGFDNREKLSTLWYHDHRLDFTAPNVYAGLSGFYLLFDELDSGNERDTNPAAFRLPSGRYDIPLILHDVQFDQNGQAAWDFLNPEPNDDQLPSDLYTVNGMLGDRFTVNRIIQPFHRVEARKYRLRILNGGPSRFYEFALQRGLDDRARRARLIVVSTDGNLLPEPIEAEWIQLAVAQRHDVIVDFSAFRPGDQVYLVNRLQMREDGAGPDGRLLDPPDLIMRFDVERSPDEDVSRVPDRLRALPQIERRLVRKERLFVFDYTNGLWTINGRLMDPNRVDAAFEQGSAEIWTFRAAGNAWSHPVHIHFEEFQILELNGKPLPHGSVERSRKDDLWLAPNDEVRVYFRARDFLGKYVMHCHNVVHEDHAMMIRWDVVRPGSDVASND